MTTYNELVGAFEYLNLHEHRHHFLYAVYTKDEDLPGANNITYWVAKVDTADGVRFALTMDRHRAHKFPHAYCMDEIVVGFQRDAPEIKILGLSIVQVADLNVDHVILE